MAVGYLLDLEKRCREELASTVQVSITSYKNRIASGAVRRMPDGRGIPFCGLDQMVLALEALLDHSSDGEGGPCRTAGERGAATRRQIRDVSFGAFPGITASGFTAGSITACRVSCGREAGKPAFGAA